VYSLGVITIGVVLVVDHIVYTKLEPELAIHATIFVLNMFEP